MLYPNARSRYKQTRRYLVLPTSWSGFGRLCSRSCGSDTAENSSEANSTRPYEFNDYRPTAQAAVNSTKRDCPAIDVSTDSSHAGTVSLDLVCDRFYQSSERIWTIGRINVHTPEECSASAVTSVESSCSGLFRSPVSKLGLSHVGNSYVHRQGGKCFVICDGDHGFAPKRAFCNMLEVFGRAVPVWKLIDATMIMLTSLQVLYLAVPIHFLLPPQTCYFIDDQAQHSGGLRGCHLLAASQFSPGEITPLAHPAPDCR